MSRPLARWRSRVHQFREQWSVWRNEWQVERELEDAVSGDGPIIVGPWLSEVGYEILYWIPFLRWVLAAYRVPSERLIAVSRGGTQGWYSGVASRYVEIFDGISSSEWSSHLDGAALKQRAVSDFDRQLIAAAQRKLGLGESVRVLHPSLMFRWFAPFWSGHETLSFVERHTRYARIEPQAITLPLDLPPEYVVVKFYAARSLPDGPVVRAQLRSLVDALSERYKVVHLDTGLGLDDHTDYNLQSGSALTVSGRLDASTNLAVQTRIIAGARAFVGTCGSLAWLAPLLGVDAIPVFTDASFLHAHLHVARRVYSRLGAGHFSPVDLSGVMATGLIVGGERLAGVRS